MRVLVLTPDVNHTGVCNSPIILKGQFFSGLFNEIKTIVIEVLVVVILSFYFILAAEFVKTPFRAHFFII